MKTSEMIAMLERNPKLEFRGKMWDDNDRRYFGVDAEGIMRFFPENSGVLYADGEFWVEVTKQPESISAGVAIKALQDGKTIHCMIGSERFTYEPDSVYYIPYTNIKYGKWFIKEDNFWRREPCLRATEAEAEVERLRAENALLRKVEEVGEIMWSEAVCHRCEARECRGCSAHDFKKALSEYQSWKERQELDKEGE